MDRQHLDELIALEEAYWWHVAKRRLVTGLLKSEFWPAGPLIEGGIGSARNLLEFQQLGYQVSGLDTLAPAVEHAHSRGLTAVRQHDLQEPWPFTQGAAQVVVLLDVLEHLADPVLVLQHARRVLQPGGGVIVTVPACPWLFGDWDRALGHFRRYTRSALQRHAGQAGFHVAWLNYWNAFSLPAAIAVRGYERWRGRSQGATFPRVMPAANRLLLGLAGIERSYLRYLRAPFGLSLVGVLRPRDGVAPSNAAVGSTAQQVSLTTTEPSIP